MLRYLAATVISLLYLTSTTGAQGRQSHHDTNLFPSQERLALASFIILQLKLNANECCDDSDVFSPGVPPVPVVLELTVRWSDVIMSSVAVPGDTKVIQPSDVIQTQASC